jgi:hypothetical protein
MQIAEIVLEMKNQFIRIARVPKPIVQIAF